ncbi:MAG: DUF1570 domain-containing protein [Phycisphaerae bacterium]
MFRLYVILTAGCLSHAMSTAVSGDHNRTQGRTSSIARPGLQSAGGAGKAPQPPGKPGKRPIPADEKAEAKALKQLPAGFRIKHTRHYSVLYNTSKEAVAAFGAAIERTYRSCTKYTARRGLAVVRPKHKLLIYYFSGPREYDEHARKIGAGKLSQSTPGIYFSGLNFGMFYDYRNRDKYKKARDSAEKKIKELSVRLRGAGSTEERKRLQSQIRQAKARVNRTVVRAGEYNERIVQHEVAHQVLWNTGLHNRRKRSANPKWLREGIAMLFETVSTGRSANIGRVNQLRLGQYRKLEKEGKLSPLRDFISTPDLFKKKTLNDAYAQGWALTHYLNRAKRKGFEEYLKLIKLRPKAYRATPEREIEDFERIFGKLDQRWETRWKTWMAKVR